MSGLPGDASAFELPQLQQLETRLMFHCITDDQTEVSAPTVTFCHWTGTKIRSARDQIFVFPPEYLDYMRSQSAFAKYRADVELKKEIVYRDEEVPVPHVEADMFNNKLEAVARLGERPHIHAFLSQSLHQCTQFTWINRLRWLVTLTYRYNRHMITACITA
jgi:hypothetical protein